MILQLAITNKHNFETSWHVGQETKMIFVPTSLKNVFIGTQWLYHHHCLLIDRLHGGAHIWLSPKTIVQIFFFFKSETRRGNQQIDQLVPLVHSSLASHEIGPKHVLVCRFGLFNFKLACLVCWLKASKAATEPIGSHRFLIGWRGAKFSLYILYSY